MSITTWNDDEERLVIYLSDKAQLYGVPKGQLVYLAGGFDERDNWWAIDDMMRRRECERIYLDE